MKSKKWILISILMIAMGSIWAQDDLWYEDFSAAQIDAKENGKFILLNFSGSDWCIWCKKLSSEVFTQKKFIQYAENNLVLALADFPRGKKQTDALKSQNESLLKKYQIQGFPTVIILDAEGNLVQKTGYRRGGAESYVSHVKAIIEQYQAGK